MRVLRSLRANRSNEPAQSKQFGVAGTGLIFNMYALSLDACAVSTWNTDNELENKLALILILALIFTFVSLCWCSVLLLLSCSAWFECCCNGNGFTSVPSSFNSWSNVCPSYSHAIHHTIAFLDDPSMQAVSLSYTPLCFSYQFGALQLSHSTCHAARFDHLKVDEIHVIHLQYKQQ